MRYGSEGATRQPPMLECRMVLLVGASCVVDGINSTVGFHGEGLEDAEYEE